MEFYTIKFQTMNLLTHLCCLLLFCGNISSKPATMQTKPSVYVDQFFVPAAAIDSFMQRMQHNRQLLRTLPGLISQEAYTRKDDQGNLHVITTASWESDAALQRARATVQEAYKKEGFDLPAMLERLHIKLERAVYQPLEN